MPRACRATEAGDEPQADAAMIAREEFERFLAALRTLPERTQRVFLLNRLDGMTYKAIAGDARGLGQHGGEGHDPRAGALPALQGRSENA